MNNVIQTFKNAVRALKKNNVIKQTKKTQSWQNAVKSVGNPVFAYSVLKRGNNCLYENIIRISYFHRIGR